MKKNGFTLSELIISLSVVAVASALMMPTISKLIPDRNKTKVITTHSKLVSATDNILDNNMIYYCVDSELLRGLSCDNKPYTSVLNDDKFAGKDKYENLIANELGLIEDDGLADNFRWKATDGSFWRFERGCIEEGVFTLNNNDCSTTNTLGYRVTVDLNGTKNPNRIYGQNDETKPDRFRFRVDNYGGITAEDALTAAYLKNSMKSTSAKKDDLRDAKNFFSDTSNYARFSSFESKS